MEDRKDKPCRRGKAGYLDLVEVIWHMFVVHRGNGVLEPAHERAANEQVFLQNLASFLEPKMNRGVKQHVSESSNNQNLRFRV